jgi:SAM-dependent methyltransferase
MTAARGGRGGGRSYRYLLGDARKEAARLRAQARLWDPVAHALFDRLGVRRGWKVLEIGPGQGSLHLDLRRRVGGPIDAVERSHAFARHLEAAAAKDGLGAGRIWNADVRDVRLPAAHYDLIFARWVFLFLPDALAHVRKLARALRPGGVLAIEDYYRDTFGMIPLPPEWPDFIAADKGFFASEGGDANIGGRLPALYRKAGLDLVEIHPTIKIARPGDAAWNWMTGYFFGVMHRYAGAKPFSRRKAASLRRQWNAAARDATSLMVAPAVLDVVGRKPRR